MGKIEQTRIVDELLSAIAHGYTNEEYVANRIFPEVPVTKLAGKARHFTKDLFKPQSTKRAIGQTSINLIDIGTREPIDWKLDEYELGTPLDYLEEDAASDINLERSKTFELSEMMLISREKRVADALQTQANYVDNNTSAVGTKWDAANSNPITDIEGGVEQIRENIGRKPNTALIGASSWSVLKHHDKIMERIKYSQKGVATPELLAEILGIPNVIIGSAVQVNPDTEVQSDVWSDNVILAYVAQGVRDQRSYRTPSFGYTLVKRAWPPIDVVVPAGGKVKIIRYTALEKQLFHGAIAGYFLRDTNT